MGAQLPELVLTADETRRCRAAHGCRGQVERRVLTQDRALELTQRPAGVEPEALGEQTPSCLVRLERFRLAIRAVEREHQLPPQALAQRLFADEPLQFGHELRMPAAGEVGLDPLFDSVESKGLEAGDLALREVLVGEVRQRRATPQREGLPQARRRVVVPARRPQPLSLLHQVLEPLRVERAGLQLERVATCSRVQPARRAERTTEARDVGMQRLARSGRRLRSVQILDQPLAEHDLAAMEEQDREERPRSRSAEGDLAAAVADAQGSEDPKLHGCRL